MTWMRGLCFLLILGSCQAEPPTFENVRAVVSAMEREGVGCEDLEITTEFSDESLVKESGRCVVDGSVILISMFESTQDRDDWVAVREAFVEVAVGEDWAVSGEPEGLLKDVADGLGATILPEG